MASGVKLQLLAFYDQQPRLRGSPDAYQCEVRLACVPIDPLENLEPVDVEIGSIEDIAELLNIY